MTGTPGKSKVQKSGGRQRALSQRTCVGCRTVRPKREMVRVVHTPAGEALAGEATAETVEVDPTGKRPGRGAYLCRRKSCWERALQRRSLDHALKTTLSEATRAALAAYARALPEDEGTSPSMSHKSEH